MKLTNFTIKDLFTDHAKLTFLVGAGCSVDVPSCLPAGRAMMEAIIRYTCPESEVEKIIKLKALRFEQLVEIVRDRLDKDLKIIDYYGLCDKPNPQHFFLAEMIKKGHYVITTNFDFLIEHALLQSNVPKEHIKPVITRKDFEKFSNPNELFNEGKKTIYKIHGSTKNLITGEDTRDSLIATIRAFGSNKEGLNTFQIEPFKRELFDNISNGRSLVVMGYSGSDDFDVVPTLKILRNVQKIIWINFTLQDEDREKIYEIEESDIEYSKNLDKVNQILTDIKRMRYVEHVYKVDANTSKLINKLLKIQLELSSVNFSISHIDWLKNNIKPPLEIEKYYIAFRIYHDFDMYDDTMRCSKEIFRIADKLGEDSFKVAALNYLGHIFFAKGDYKESFKHFQEGLKISQQKREIIGVASGLSNIGQIFYAKGNYHDALKVFEEALKINEQLGDLDKKAYSLNNIGIIYKTTGNYPEALKQYEISLRIWEQLGDLLQKSNTLSDIGELLYATGNYEEALKRNTEGLKIAEQLGALSTKCMFINNIGKIFYAKGNYDEALKQFQKALKITKQLGQQREIATNLNNIATFHYSQGNYSEALRQYEIVLKIDDQLGDLYGKIHTLNNIGIIYKTTGKYPEALKRYEKASNIADQLDVFPLKAVIFNNMGSINYTLGNYPEALRCYEEALRIDKQLGNLAGKATDLNNIAALHYSQGNYPEALRQYEIALKIFEKVGSPKAKIIKDLIEGIKYEMKK